MCGLVLRAMYVIYSLQARSVSKAKRKEERAGYDVSNPAAFWLGTSQGTAGTVLPPPPPPAPPPPPPAPLPQAPVPQAPPQAPPPPPLT